MGILRRRQILIVALAATVLVVMGSAAGLFLTSSNGGRSTSLGDLSLQPNDLPSEFTLAVELLYSREDLMTGLPASAQVAEEGLREAIHRSYKSQGFNATVIDVFVYSYEDEAATEQAHAHVLHQDWNYVLRRVYGDSEPHGYQLDGTSVEGLGDHALAMTGELDTDTDSAVSVSIYFIRSGSVRAEVIVAGAGAFLDPEGVARNQYLRLERPEAVVGP